MKKFKLTEPLEAAAYFDRQARISWWDQSRVQEARVLIVGAGAVGNEVMKNLVLCGVGHVCVVDFDTIEESNLSRTVLFRPDDVGRSKAEVAAKRVSELKLEESGKIEAIHGDVVWDLGLGIFRRADVVLGCVDNIEARLAVNRMSWGSGTPWIDSGIRELGSRIEVFIPPEPPCWKCNATEQQLGTRLARYSCDYFKKKSYAEERVPTVQVAGAFAAAIQAQEALKLLCGHGVEATQRIFFQGSTNELERFNLRPNPRCIEHLELAPTLKRIPLSGTDSLGTLLSYVSSEEASGEGATLDFRGDRSFVTEATCPGCSQRVRHFKAEFRITSDELLCPNCLDAESTSPTGTVEAERIAEFSEERTPETLMTLSLAEIGVPFGGVCPVRSRDGKVQFYELDGDFKNRLKEW